jgi:hypothetical protein
MLEDSTHRRRRLFKKRDRYIEKNAKAVKKAGIADKKPIPTLFKPRYNAKLVRNMPAVKLICTCANDPSKTDMRRA